MIKKRKQVPSFGNLPRETEQDVEELRDAIEHEYNKAQEWRNKFEELYRKVFISKETKKQLGLF